jgi:5,10-methylenetetrahydromethanopterin reductase
VLAEELGYARVWIYDSAPLWEDPFVHLALAAERTRTIGFATAVLIPAQRSVLTMASSIATIARLSNGRFRACFGTEFTARYAAGRRPMTMAAVVDGAAVRMLHADGLTTPRPIEVPVWLSVFGRAGSNSRPRSRTASSGHPTRHCRRR